MTEKKQYVPFSAILDEILNGNIYTTLGTKKLRSDFRL